MNVNRLDITFWDAPPAPARTFPEYLSRAREVIRTGNRAARVAAFMARYQDVSGPDFVAAVEGGLELANTGASIGGTFGPIGMGVGAAGGFLAGIVAGIVPVSRNIAESQWDRLVAAMPALDRYGLFSQVKGIADRAARSESKVFNGGDFTDPTGPWRWADDPPLGHSPWGGQVGRVVNLLERLFRVPCVPNSVRQDSKEVRDLLALYVLCFVSGAHDDQKKPTDMRAVWPLIANGSVAPGLVNEIGQYHNVYLGTLRDRLRGAGVPSIWNPLVTPAIRRELEATR